MSKKVKCVRCKKEFQFADSPYRPFCSERCKEADLGTWLLEGYRIPTNEVVDFPTEGDYEDES